MAIFNDLNNKILKLAIPNIISNISIPLIGMIDLAIIGHLDSAVYLGAIAIGGMIFNFIFWGLGFLRMGTSGFTAQAYGARNLKESVAILTRAIVISFLLGIIIILLQKVIANISFSLLEGSLEVERWAKSYFFIRIYSAPATLCMFAITGWFIGMQNSKTPMVLAIITNLLNLLFNLTFVYIFNYKSDGVAWGTVLAQYVGVLFTFLLLWRFYKKLWKYFALKTALQWSKLLIFFKVNSNIFIRTFCIIIVFSLFTARSAEKGDIILAVNTLLMQFFTFFSFLIDGFAYAAEAITGKAVGSKNKNGLLLSVKMLFRWGWAIALIFSLLYIFGGNLLISFFTDNPKILHEASKYIVLISLIPLVSMASFLWDGVYIGATASKSMRNVMLVATVLVFLPVWYIWGNSMENSGLWLSFLLFLSARSIIQSIAAKRAVFQHQNFTNKSFFL